MDSIAGPVFEAVSNANDAGPLWPRLRAKLFDFASASQPFECSLYHAEFMHGLVQQCDNEEVRAVVNSLLVAYNGVPPLGLDCSECTFLRLRSLTTFSDQEFAHVRATLVSASDTSEQELVGKVLDLLRHPPDAYDESTVGRLLVQPAAEVSGGRIPFGSAATIQGPVPAGTLLPYIYSAVYSGKETTESWLWESVAAVLLSELGLPDTPSVRAELYKSHYGRQCMVEACSYDVTGVARPAADKEQVTWNGLGIYFHSTLGAMNDPRGSEAHLSYLQGRLGDRHFMAQQPDTRAEAEDTWVRANVLGHPAKKGLEQLMVDCSLQFISVGGILPVVVAVAQAAIPPGVHEACVSYGDGYWSFRAYFESDIPWLPLYRRVAHAPPQGDAQQPIVVAEWLPPAIMDWSPSTTQQVEHAVKSILGRARQAYTATLSSEPAPLHPVCASSGCLLGKIGPHELCCDTSTAHDDLPDLVPAQALSCAAHSSPVCLLPTVVFTPDLWFPSLIEAEQQPASFVLWPTDAFVDHADLSCTDPPLSSHDHVTSPLQLVVACLSSSLRTIAGTDVPCVQVLRFPSAAHARLVLRYALDPVPNSHAGDDGSRTSASLGFGGPLTSQRLHEQHYATRGCICLTDRDVPPAYLSAFLACAQAVASVMTRAPSGKAKGKVKPPHASGPVAAGNLLDSAHDATEKAVADLDAASARALPAFVGQEPCAHAKLQRASHYRRARNQVLNLLKAGQMDGLTVQSASIESLCLHWEDVPLAAGQAVCITGEHVLVRLGARLHAALDGNWVGKAFMASKV